MTTRPDDIPVYAWEAAEAALLAANTKAHMLAEPTDPLECISRAILTERDRIIAGLDFEAEVTPCHEDAMVVQSCADLVRADFSYDGVEEIQTAREAAQ